MLSPDSKSLFPLGNDVTYLNHGGFGVMPLCVLEDREKNLRLLEANPLLFFDKNYKDNHYERWRATTSLVAERFSARPKNLALIDNATDGIVAVLRSLVLNSGDEILLTSWTYGAIKLAAKHIASKAGSVVVEAALDFPNPDPEQCVDAFKKTLSSRTKIAVIDHIASGTGVVLPIKELIDLCRTQGVPVLIDGAHAPGQVALDIAALAPDWYVGNLHKWSFAARACGFLWAASDHYNNLLPNVLSWEIERPFPGGFEWTGTRDSTSWMSIPKAFAFMDRFGEKKVRAHNHKLIRDAGAMLSDEWGCNAGVPDIMMGSIALIGLPTPLPFEATDGGCGALQRALWNDGNIAALVPFCDKNGRFWIRLSAQIYNGMADFERLAHFVRQLR